MPATHPFGPERITLCGIIEGGQASWLAPASHTHSSSLQGRIAADKYNAYLFVCEHVYVFTMVYTYQGSSVNKTTKPVKLHSGHKYMYTHANT